MKDNKKLNIASQHFNTQLPAQNIDELLSILHTAIQNKEEYPQSALQMERQGKVTVSFILFSSGQIENLHLKKSSGTGSLDEAALKAVQEAVPFKHISAYLKNPREYTIDVYFELA